MKRFIQITCFLLALLMICCSFSVFAASETKLVAITFDDGPSKFTPKLLDGLKKCGAKATFFMVGSNVSTYPDVVKRMKSEGHQLATHTMTHANLAKLSAAAIEKEVTGVDDRLKKIVGDGVYYLRPPYGSFNETVKKAVKVPLVYWSVDTLDWQSRNADAVYNKIINLTKDGDILLLHDLYETSVDGALRAIEELQSKGYVFVTVETLLKRRGITPRAGSVYYDAPNVGINLPAVVSPVIATRVTPLGVKLYVGKNSATDTVYFTSDGQAPKTDGNLYSKPHYINEAKQIKAVSFNENELSDISEYQVTEIMMSKEDIDAIFYRYKVPFLNHKVSFKPGMKI